MGCDIHTKIEVRKNGKWVTGGDGTYLDWQGKPGDIFDWRSYGMFGFLANVRNYSNIPLNFGDMPRGIPADSILSRESRQAMQEANEATKRLSWGYGSWQDDYDEVYWDTHNHTWLSLRELLDFDYDQPVEDRRVTRQVGLNSWNGACTAEPGGGEMTTYREFLGKQFFEHLAVLKEEGAPDDVRVLMWFDN